MGPHRTRKDTARQREGEGHPRWRGRQSEKQGSRGVFGQVGVGGGEWPGGGEGTSPAEPVLPLPAAGGGASRSGVRGPPRGGGSGPGERESRPPSSSFPIGPRRGFGERLRRLRRVLADLGVLVRGGQGACLTAVVFPTDRSGMENSASVEQLQETLLRALRALVLKNRPSETSRFTKLLLKLPDLRTLNNMHSEKLLSFRVDAQ